MQLKFFVNTLVHLKPIQVRYRLFYLFRKHLRKITRFSYPLSIPAEGGALDHAPFIKPMKSWQGQNRFVFLNQFHDFGERIGWNCFKYGKLWAYNLNYFDFLLQEEMDKEQGFCLIKDFMDQAATNREGMEPFPVSLRCMNWIRFILVHKIKNPEIDAFLYAQYRRLQDNLEYHILGNHLLENGFSLMFGALYFNDKVFYITARRILFTELEEQVLPDGAHFELSPMYHQIMLARVLDCINLLQHNRHLSLFSEEMLTFLKKKVVHMLGWLKEMTFSNGDIPLFNDAAPDIAPASSHLMAYASSLNLVPVEVRLKESGYRKFTGKRYEMIVDAGQIGPDYIPGHGHCDMFSFVLYVDGKPFIVDTGTSTYEAGERRQLERSTSAHNTVSVDGLEQSEVWSAFRVGRRARIVELKEDGFFLEATHDGFKSKGVLHTRRFEFFPERICITDTLSKPVSAEAVLHFDCQSSYDGVRIVSTASCETSGYMQARGFNLCVGAEKSIFAFKKMQQTEIFFE